MNKYVRQGCVFCENKLMAEDDIVICPDCGAPSHRACFTLEHGCAFCKEDGGKLWTGEIQPPLDLLRGEEPSSLIYCEKCKKENQKHCKICTHCGFSLEEKKKNNFASEMDELSNLLFHEMHEDEKIDGYSVKDIKTFVGKNAPYYINRFQMMSKTGRKYIPNFSAFFFTSFYFFYRKMWLTGAILYGLELLLSIPSALLGLYQQGIVLSAFAHLDYTKLASIQMAFVVFVLLLRIGSGIYANRLYRKKTFCEIDQAKQEQNYDKILLKKGSTCPQAILFIYIGIPLVVSIFSLI